MKVGRNAPCPCGSGRKYKKCCMNKTQPPVDLFQRRLSEAYDRLMEELIRFAEETFGDVALVLAAGEFLVWPEADEDQNPLEMLEGHMSLFMPWFMFNWFFDPEIIPESLDVMGIRIDIPPHQTIAEIYARRHGKRLDSLQRRLLEALNERPFSFLEVISCNPGQGFRLRDVLTGEQSDVVEKEGSENAEPGDLLLGRVVQVDHVVLLPDAGQALIPPSFKPLLVEFRKTMQKKAGKITAEVLADFAFGVRGLYFDILEELSSPPEMRNTDGDPLLFHSLHYEIEDSQQAFDKLAGLAEMEDPENLRADAVLDGEGRIVRAEIPWIKAGNRMHESWDNTLLGRLVIDGDKLTVDVNSEARATAIRREIEKRLGSGARYRTTTVKSPQAMMEQEAAADDDEDGPSREQLMQIPEVRQQIENMLRSHWEGWVDESVPALGGRSPRQAVKTPDGREKVEALLQGAGRDMERNMGMCGLGEQIIDDVRRRLGLDGAPAVAPKGKGKDNGTRARRVAQVRSLIEEFGRARLDEQHTGFALRLCDRIARMRKLNLQRGRVEIWAAAIVYVIARLNFLFDRDSELFIRADDICEHFGTRKSTTANKATAIEKACGPLMGQEGFCRQEIVDMLTFYETPEGFILPKSLLSGKQPGKDEAAPGRPDDAEQGPADEGKDSAPGDAKGQDAGKRESEETGPRQLKLFDDD